MEGMCFALGIDKNVKWKPVAPGSLQKYQDFWEYSKKYILNDKLQKTIQKYTQEEIIKLDEETIEKLRLLIDNPAFDKDKIQQASEAAFNLSLWIRAVYNVYMAVKMVEPKKAQLEKALENLKLANELLEEKK